MGNISTTSQALAISNMGAKIISQGVITMSTSYAAAGDAATARQFGMGFVESLQIQVSTSGHSLFAIGPPTAGASFTIGALMAGSVSAIGTTTAGLTIAYIATGSVGLRATGTADTVVTGVPTAGTSLSAVTARFLAIGY